MIEIRCCFTFYFNLLKLFISAARKCCLLLHFYEQLLDWFVESHIDEITFFGNYVLMVVVFERGGALLCSPLPKCLVVVFIYTRVHVASDYIKHIYIYKY